MYVKYICNLAESKRNNMKTKESKSARIQRLELEKINIANQVVFNSGIKVQSGDSYAVTVTGASYKINKVVDGMAEVETIGKCNKYPDVYNFRMKIGNIHHEKMEQVQSQFEKGYIHLIQK